MDKGFINVMEEVVTTLVNVTMMSPDYQTFCHCQKCRNDIIALCLNNLPTHYVTREQGRIYVFEQLNREENRKWMNMKIIQAIHVVGKYPKHDQ